jgi:hypothetical protein
VPEQENTITDLKRFLSTQENPVTMEEFKEFWNTCTDEEKMEFKSTKLE